MSTEKRNLQMDLETARTIYKKVPPIGGHKEEGWYPWFVNKIIASMFTIDELEGSGPIQSKLEKEFIDQYNFFDREIEKKKCPTYPDIAPLALPPDYMCQQSMGFKKEQEKLIPPFTLEVAQGYFKDLQAYPKCKSLIGLNNVASHFYTQDQLEGKTEKKGFTWEESFKPGYSIESIPPNIHLSKPGKMNIKKCSNPIAQDHFKDQYATEKQALFALAFAQLTHIVAKYNEGRVKPENIYNIVNNQGVLDVRDSMFVIFHLGFYAKEDAETSLEVNQDLWKQYWMID